MQWKFFIIWILIVVAIVILQYFKPSHLLEQVFVRHGLNLNKNLQQKLEPVKHIAFLKVHKASSSTIQNIFMRYGYENKLTFVLPLHPPTISMRDSVIINKNAYPPPGNKSFDILCCHCLYDRRKFEKVLPNDTVYIGAVREPFKQFISMVNYDHHRAIFQIKDPKPVRAFLQNPRQLSIQDPYQDIPTTNNRMAYDFGFPQHLFTSYDEKAVDFYLQKLDKEMGLVIVTEYFDESLVLLRRLLRWNVKDILYVKLNKMKYDPTLLSVGKEEELLYRQWAKLDYALYNFFHRKLLQQIAREGNDFKSELENFRLIRQEVEEFCGYKFEDVDLWKEFNKTNWHDDFAFSTLDCEQVMKAEVPFLNILRHKQGYI